MPAPFDGKRFHNPAGPEPHGWRDVLRWKRTSHREPSPEFVDDVVPSKPPRRVEGDALRVTLVNHSTVLLQHRGANFLTDPIWSERASPVSWAGPRRHRNPGVSLEDLPPLDVVLISHNHYDHLDLPTLRRLPARFFVVPRGVGQWLLAKKIGQVCEMDWGEWLKIAGCGIRCVPAFHFSGRSLSDRNRTLWCGYVVESAAGVIYFAGDTAFGPHFAQIRETCGPPRLALLPIGAYAPRWFMSPVHMDPQEAAEAHRILGAATSIAIHHGTFQLGDDAIDTPRRQLLECAPGESFLVLANGQSVEIP